MAYANMRFGDALHTSPALIMERTNGVELVRLQTTDGSFRSRNSSQVWMSLKGQHLKVISREISGFSEQMEKWANLVFPSHMQNFVTMLRSMSIAAVNTFISDPTTIDRLRTSVNNFTAHSSKATLLSELAHAHADPQVLMSQGHWTKMPVKCTRNSHAISVKGVKVIITNLKAEWESEDVNSGIGFSEDEEDDTMAKNLVSDQAGVPSGNQHDEDVCQHRVEKFGLSDATPADQTRKKKLPDPKLDRVSLPRELHWIRNAFF